MASADCQCCGQSTTVPEPVEIEPEECGCGCEDCDECGDCYHEDEELVTVQPPVLCDDCGPDLLGEGECGPGAWHCDGRLGHSCDGTVCEERVERLTRRLYVGEFRNGSTCGPDCK
ncbi:MAG TPA: hypothetical protein VLA89_14050, partial [Gemmatimonadales bacterium]|nr:hypothetical protein [Gemmatimonadales bacterium]